MGASPSPSLNAAGATTGSSVLAGGLWNGLTNVLPPCYALIQSVVAARVLGPEGMGRQSLIAWSALSTALLFTAGVPIALLRYVGKTFGEGRPGDARDLFRWAWRVEAIGAALGGGALVLVALTRSDLRAAWLLAAVVASLSIMQAVPSAVLWGLQRWKQASLIGLVTGTLGTAAVVVVLLLGGGIAGMFAVEAVITAANLAGAGLLARRAVSAHPAPPEPARELRREVRRYAAAASVHVLFVFVVWRRSEFFFLNRYSGPAQIALYSVAFSGLWALQQVVAGVSSALSPAFATLIGAGQVERVRSGVSRALRLSVLVSLPVAAGVLALGPAALRLAYGDDYSGTAPVLRVLALAFPVIIVSKVAGSLLQGLGLIRAMITASAIATVVDIALSLLLIPAHGALGAAGANSAAQVTGASLMLIFACRAVPVGREGRVVLSTALASAAGGVAAWAPLAWIGGALGLLIGAATGTVAFIVLAVRLRIVPPGDARWLDESAGARLGGLVGRLCRPFADVG